MTYGHRILAVASVVLLMALVKIGQQLYSYYAFSEERVAIVRLEADVDREGLGVITSQLRADGMRIEIDAADADLGESREELDRLERAVLSGRANPETQRVYQRLFAEYNQAVGRRNALFEEWRTAVEGNHAHVERYNLLVDSIRALATLIGEPYYPILSPAEIAARYEAENGAELSAGTP